MTMNANDRSITGFTMLAHALFHVYELSIPVFVVSWLTAFDVTPATIGLVVGVGYAFVGIGAVPAGIFADSVESRKLILGVYLGMATGFAILAIAPTIGVVAVGLGLWGVASSLYHPAGLALLSRGTEERGTALAYHGAAGNIGTVVGPLLAAIGLTLFRWRIVAALFILPAILGAALAIRVNFDETAGVSETERFEEATDERGISDIGDIGITVRSLVSVGFVLVFAIIMSYGLYYRGVLTFLPKILAGFDHIATVELRNMTFEPATFVYSGLLLVGVGGQYTGGRLSDAYDNVRLLVGMFVALVVSALLFVPAATGGLLALALVSVLLGFSLYVVVPVYQATIADYFPAEVHGLSYGITYLGMFGVGAVGSTLAGAILTWADYRTLFVALAVIAGVAAGLAAILLRRS